MVSSALKEAFGSLRVGAPFLQASQCAGKACVPEKLAKRVR